MSSPVLNDDLRFLQCVEDLAVEQFVSQFAVEAFAVTVLPRTARFNVSGLCSNGGDPIPQSLGDELGAVV